MGKKFKNKICVYCGEAAASKTADHVFAREFVALEHRGHLPKVPACVACNAVKSSYEHYLTAVLPFGARHASALENLTENVPKRLSKNQKLLRTLNVGLARNWYKAPSGVIQPTLALPLNIKNLFALVGMMARGLMFHHWGVILDRGINVKVLHLTKYDEVVIRQNIDLNAKQRIKNNLGRGALEYEGAQGVDNDSVSVWLISIYGGIRTISDDEAEPRSNFGVFTGPSTIIDNF